MKRVKAEKGITLVMLVIYVALITVVIGLLATFSNYIYPKLAYINSSSISYEEFNKFNVNFIADCKECPTSSCVTTPNLTNSIPIGCLLFAIFCFSSLLPIS